MFLKKDIKLHIYVSSLPVVADLNVPQVYTKLWSQYGL